MNLAIAVLKRGVSTVYRRFECLGIYNPEFAMYVETLGYWIQEYFYSILRIVYLHDEMEKLIHMTC